MHGFSVATSAVARLPLTSPLCSCLRAPARMRILSAGSSIATSATDVDGGTHKKLPWLIVGLGNPGKLYQGTRHNVGFQMIDAIAEAEGISLSKMQFKALFGKGQIGDVPIILAKPQTFMNASGGPTCFILQNSTKSSTSDV